MTKSDLPSRPGAGLSRRSLLKGAAGGAVGMALAPLLGSLPVQAAATPGSNPGKYKLDLGGYDGPELTSDTIQLRFMRQDYTPEANALFASIYEEFTKGYPNITVQEERVPYGDLPKKVQVYIASGSAPDLMMGRNDFASAYAAGQLAAPLQNYLTADYINDISAPLRDSATIDGNLLCLPWETNPTFMYFNRDIFTKHGVKTPPEVSDVSQGWTFDEMLATLDELTSKIRASGDTQTYALASSQYGNGGPGSNYAQLESMWVRMMGNNKADPNSSLYHTFLGVSADGFTATGYLDTDEAITGMTHYQTLFKKGYTPTGNVSNQYLGGTAALDFGTMNNATWMRAHPDKFFKWGTTPAPHDTMYYSPAVADSPFIWAGGPHLNETAALLAFICNDANRTSFHAIWGSMPVRQSLLDKNPLYKTDQTNMLAVSTAAAGFGPPRTPGWFDYFNAVNPAVKDIALGADPATRLHQVASEIDGLLSKYKS